MENIKKHIRSVPDFPKKGILFRDITPLLQDAQAFREAIDIMTEKVKDKEIQCIVGIESRGFIFGSALAYKLGLGLVIVRKLGKLPHERITATYDLEYGKDTLEAHRDAMAPGTKALIVDDLLATGGTADGTGTLIKKLGGEIAGYLFLIELLGLDGREKLKPYPVWSILEFPA